MTFLNGIQPITSTFCTVIGEPNKGTFFVTYKADYILTSVVSNITYYIYKK